MASDVTETTFAKLNTITTIAATAATADEDSLAEEFTITPTKAGIKGLLIIGGTGAGADGDITFSLAAGDLWAGKAIGGTVTKNTEKGILIDSAMVLQNDGTITLTLTPAATDKLLTDHHAYVKFIELL